MEDQQSPAGDLTDDATLATGDTNSEGTRRRHRMPVGKARRGATSLAASSEAQPDPIEPEDIAESETAEPEAVSKTAPAVSVVFAERRKAGRWAPAAVGVAAALFIGSAAFAGATVQPYLSNRAAVDTKLDIARTAAEAITTLWTYTPDNMESLADRSARFLGGDFEAQYRKYVDAIAPTNKQAQVTNNTQVVGAAVETLDGSDATAIVYTNSTATSPLTKDIPSLRYLSYRLTMTHSDAQWLVTSMTTITSLDLTPQI
ncbi:Mce associated membrane protein [soil metagenome]